MAQCPFCKTELGDDFGLIECPSCHKASLIDVDGQVQLADPAEQVASDPGLGTDVSSLEPGPSEVSENSVTSEPNSEFEFESESESESESISELNFDLAPDSNLDFGLGSRVEAESDVPVLTPISEPNVGTSLASPSSTTDYFDHESAPSPLESYGGASSSTSTNRGNDGNLRYTLTISGVDTADLRKELLEALTDRKFLWDAEAILKSVRNGQLKIVDLNAVKAAVLVARLKSLPLQISWEQHALHTD